MQATTNEFETFVKELNDFHSMVKGKGIRMTHYNCHHCDHSNETVRPTDKMVEGKGYWDGCKRCTKCGKRNYVAVYPSGETQVVPFNL